jgi:hypothetical protein
MTSKSLTPKPKIATAGITAGALVVIVAGLGAITPDLLTFAGAWSSVIYAGVVGLISVLAGYLKSE